MDTNPDRWFVPTCGSKFERVYNQSPSEARLRGDTGLTASAASGMNPTDQRRRRDSNPRSLLGYEGSDVSNCDSNELGHGTDDDTARLSAVSAESVLIDADLARLILTWPSLPQSVRDSIVKMIDAAGSNE